MRQNVFVVMNLNDMEARRSRQPSTKGKTHLVFLGFERDIVGKFVQAYESITKRCDGILADCQAEDEHIEDGRGCSCVALWSKVQALTLASSARRCGYLKLLTDPFYWPRATRRRYPDSGRQ